MKNERPVAAPRSAAGRSLSWRGPVLTALLLVVALMLLPAFKNLFDQHSRIVSLEDQIKANQQLVAKLQGEVDRWTDPAYVRAQARERLYFVMPGEVGYIVLDGKQAKQVADVTKPANHQAWYRTMWQSMRRASETAAASG